MNHFIKDIAIQNFKSIQKVEIKDCSRINIFIGEPNVGKSNILEALAIAGIPYNYGSNFNYAKECIRKQAQTDLYYNGNINEFISIRVIDNELNRISIVYNWDDKFLFTLFKKSMELEKKKSIIFAISYDSNYEEFKELLKIEGFLSQHFPTRKYHFSPNTPFQFVRTMGNVEDGTFSLSAPFGKDLPLILTNNKSLMKDVQELFTKYDQKLVLDRTDNTIKIFTTIHFF